MIKISSGTKEWRTKRAGALAGRFRKSRSVEKWVGQHSQNSRVYGFENKHNIQDSLLFHHTNKQSKKVMVSACVTWKGASKPFSWKSIAKHIRFETQFQNIHKTLGKVASSRSQLYYE